MPLGPKDSRNFHLNNDVRKNHAESRAGGPIKPSGSKCVGIQPKFAGMSYKGGQWVKK